MVQLLEPQLLDLSRFRNTEVVTALRNTPDYFRKASQSRKETADKALRDWFEEWLTIPVCHFFYMPMTGYLQLMGMTTILLRRARLKLLARYRLGDAPHPTDADFLNQDTHSTEASSGLDDLMLDLLERLASRFEEAKVEMAAAHCSEWANDFLNLVAWKLRERKDCTEKWMAIIANEARHPANERSGVEAGGGMERPGVPAWLDGGGMNGADSYQNMEDPGLWLDPLEELLLSGQAFESWL